MSETTLCNHTDASSIRIAEENRPDNVAIFNLGACELEAGHQGHHQQTLSFTPTNRHTGGCAITDLGLCTCN